MIDAEREAILLPRRVMADHHPDLGDAWDDPDTGLPPCSLCREVDRCDCGPGGCECVCGRCGHGGELPERWGLYRWRAGSHWTRWHVWDPVHRDGSMLCGVRLPPSAGRMSVETAITGSLFIDGAAGGATRGTGSPPLPSTVCRGCHFHVKRSRARWAELKARLR